MKSHRISRIMSDVPTLITTLWKSAWGVAVLVFWLMLPGILSAEPSQNADRIKPYTHNPQYWQYQGAPLMLLGGSKDDNLFQISDLENHLQELKQVGGNYIRNTMSDRNESNVYAFKQLGNGKYDLDQWNDEYWARFANLLKWTHDHDIIVQIEVWDRFDFSDHKISHPRMRRWSNHPFNPANNINYTSEESGLATLYPDHHPGRDLQPFFHTSPGMEKYKKRYDVIRKYQDRYVAKLLSQSLSYGNVLYCMNNETTTSPRWGQYWIDFIRCHARDQGVDVYLTDMFDDGHAPEESSKIRAALDEPDVYSFIDISQVNSRNFNEDHWDKLQWYMREIKSHPRPLNNTKIYGSGNSSWGSGTPEDGIERFWRDLLAGCASARFHRNGVGNGLNPNAKASIQAARKVEATASWWDIEPRNDLLQDRTSDEAYLACRPGKSYVLYFTEGGSVGLDLKGHEMKFSLQWINISDGGWGEESEIAGDRVVPISAPSKGPWAAVLTSVNQN